MNPLRPVLFFLFLLCAFPLRAQESRLLVLGQISRAETGELLPDAVVKVKDAKNMTLAGRNGRYAILVETSPAPTLEFIFYGCETKRIRLDESLLKKAKNDTLRLDVQLKFAPQMDSGVTVRAKGPDTVIGNWRFFIEDYMFVDERYVLLTWEKSLKAAKVTLASEAKGVIAQQNVPGEARELYRDYQGKINVLCTEGVYQVKVSGDELRLLELPFEQFAERMLPCVDSLQGRIIFSNYSRDYPAFSYFTYDPADTSVLRLRHIVDEPLMGMYQYEFDFLKPKERLYARKMEMYTGVDKRIIAATMTGFTKSHYYTPLYAPLFVVRDTICVFDHYVNALFKYDCRGKRLDSLGINYHHPKSWRDWDRRLIQDETTKELYTIYEKGGFYYLKKISTKTGQITGTFKISNTYAKHIRVRDGFVYYIYRPYESTQKKFLYREKVTLKPE